MAASISPAVRYSRLSTAYVRTVIRPSFCLMAPNSAIGFPNCSARGCVASRLADRDGRSANAHGAQLEASEVQHVERHLVALAGLAQQITGRHARVLQHQRRGR